MIYNKKNNTHFPRDCRYSVADKIGLLLHFALLYRVNYRQLEFNWADNWFQHVLSRASNFFFLYNSETILIEYLNVTE